MKHSKVILSLLFISLLTLVGMKVDAQPKEQESDGHAGTFTVYPVPGGSIYRCAGEPTDCLFVPDE